MHFASPVQSPKPTFCQLSTSLWLFWLSPFNYVVKLEQLHQLVHKFFHFTHLFLQNSHISLSFLQVYSNKIFISLPTQPPTQTGITLESIQPISRKLEKQTQQQDRCTRNQHNPTTHNPATRNWNKPSNIIPTTHPKSTPRLEQQDRCLRWR